LKQATVDALDNALAERDKLAVARAGLAERELIWKQRVNTLRTALSGELVALGVDRDEP
jgi:hypothetical protein